MRFQLCIALFLAGFAGADYSNAVYNQVKYMSNYAKVAYCTVKPIFTEGPLNQKCPAVEFCTASTGIELVSVFHPNIFESEISGSGYVAVDHDERKVYAIFRGSLTPGDFITDVLFGYCPYAPILKNDNITASLFSDVNKTTSTEEVAQRIEENSDGAVCTHCNVHCGVYVAMTQFLQETYDSAKSYLDNDYQLVISGHSLGGGYGALAGIEFLQLGYKPLVITFAGLRIGNPAFNHFVDTQFGTEAAAGVVGNGGDLPIPSFSRVYQETDIVPRLPPGNYTHSGLQFEITKLRIPHEKANVVFLGASNNDANSPFNFNLDDPLGLFILYQHLHQFQRISWPCNDLQFRKRDDDTWDL